MKGRASTDLLITNTCHPGENVVFAGDSNSERENGHGDIALPNRVREGVALIETGIGEHSKNEEDDQAFQECDAREDFLVDYRDDDWVRKGDP